MPRSYRFSTKWSISNCVLTYRIRTLCRQNSRHTLIDLCFIKFNKHKGLIQTFKEKSVKVVKRNVSCITGRNRKMQAIPLWQGEW